MLELARMSSTAPFITSAFPDARRPVPEVPPEGKLPQTAPSPAVRFLVLLALYAIPAFVTLRPVGSPVLDPDIWWHLRCGQWVIEQGTVPVHDPFSGPGLDKPWVAYSWLYEVLLCNLYTWLGLAGVIVYRVGMAFAIVAVVHRLVARREPRFLVASSLTAAGVFAISMLFSERPWLFTILFTTWTLDVLLDLRAGRPTRRAWLLPVVFALWANIHIQFVYGLVLLGLACAAGFLDRLSVFGPSEPRAWRSLLALTAACLVATLLTPYHVRLYAVVLEYATQPGPFRFVNELKALEFREPCDWVMLALGAAATFTLGRRKAPDSFQVLVLAAAAVFAFRARRDLWFLVVASLAVLRSGEPGGSRRPHRLGARPVARQPGSEGRGSVPGAGGGARLGTRLPRAVVQRFQLGRLSHLEPASSARRH
jgi:hypothetical protein